MPIAAYKAPLAGLTADLENLKTLPGMVWGEDEDLPLCKNNRKTVVL
jgi:hypothetical protein